MCKFVNEFTHFLIYKSTNCFISATRRKSFFRVLRGCGHTEWCAWLIKLTLIRQAPPLEGLGRSLFQPLVQPFEEGALP